MGCLQSTPTKYAAPLVDSVEELAKETNFSEAEVKALQQLFSQVSNSVIQDGLIHKVEFFSAMFDISEGTLFAERVFAMFDSKQNGVIEFGEFARALSVFHPKASMDDKIKFAFSIYDKDNSGFISKTEVKDFLFALMSENSSLHFSDSELETIVEQTFDEVDLARDERIQPAEWQTFCENNPAAINYMTLPVLRDLVARFPEAVK